jgi:hypothetical protein
MSAADRAAALARVEALILWCRSYVEPPPADLLYAAAYAVERLRQETRDVG